MADGNQTAIKVDAQKEAIVAAAQSMAGAVVVA